MMLRRLLLAGLCCALVLGVATLLPARQGVVHTIDGQVIEGEVEEEGESIVITVRGIRTIVPRERVRSIEYPPDVQERLRQQHADLEPYDVQGRIDLARWAFDRREYVYARELLEETLEINPRSVEAAELLDLVRSQIRMERARRQAEQARRPDGEDPDATDPEGAEPEGADPERADAERRPVRRPSRTGDRPLLTRDEINIIRQQEMQSPQDMNIRIRFERDVRRRFVNERPITMPEFNRLRPFEQAEMIIREGDVHLQQDVQIISDPIALADFRRAIQPIILAGCATSGCHGGTDAGDFVLHTPGNSDAAAYTNFFILQRYMVMVEPRGGLFGPGMAERRLVDRTQPEQSILVQYALPPSIADLPHPDVPGQPYRGVFRNRQDPRYRQFINWIGGSLKVVEPDYPIEYDAPGMERRRPEGDADDAEPSEEPQEPEEAMDDEVPDPDRKPVEMDASPDADASEADEEQQPE